MFDVLHLDISGKRSYTIYIHEAPAGVINSDETSILNFLANVLNVESVTIEDVIHTTYPDLMINDGDELQYEYKFYSETAFISLPSEEGAEQINSEDF